ncbi:hypothetical protein ACL1CM_14425, partial [Corynebacterium striatum]
SQTRFTSTDSLDAAPLQDAHHWITPMKSHYPAPFHQVLLTLAATPTQPYPAYLHGQSPHSHDQGQ